MKQSALVFFSAFVFALSVSAQSKKIPAVIYLKDGSTISVYHFGQKVCGNNRYLDSYIIVRGKYSGLVTEIKKYDDIRSIDMKGFTEPPVASVGNEKAVINVTKKNGVTVSLEEAELVMSCYGPGDKYNRIKVQIMNPLTEEIVEKSVEVKDIDMVRFE